MGAPRDSPLIFRSFSKISSQEIPPLPAAQKHRGVRCERTSYTKEKRFSGPDSLGAETDVRP